MKVGGGGKLFTVPNFGSDWQNGTKDAGYPLPSTNAVGYHKQVCLSVCYPHKTELITFFIVHNDLSFSISISGQLASWCVYQRS